MRQQKILIVGAGLVGGSAALFCAHATPSAEIVVIDIEPVRAEGQVLDLAHAAAMWGHNRFHAGSHADATDADVVVITAGAGVKPGQPRLDLVTYPSLNDEEKAALKRSAEIVKEATETGLAAI